MKATAALFVMVAVAAAVVVAVVSGSSPVELSQDLSQLGVRELQARLQKDENGLIKSAGAEALAFAQDEAAVRPALKNALARQVTHPASLRQRMSSVDTVMPTGRMFSSGHHHTKAAAAGLVDTSQYTNAQLERLSSSQHALWLARANAFKELEESGMHLAAKGRKEILDGFHNKKLAKVELDRAHEQLKDSLAAKTLYNRYSSMLQEKRAVEDALKLQEQAANLKNLAEEKRKIALSFSQRIRAIGGADFQEA